MAGSTHPMSDSEGIVSVVHCVDTEGPIGGNVRRRADGSEEFMARWSDIRTSLRPITSNEFREANRDTAGNPYRFNWFVMDFTGFRTNPKCRIDTYNDTYDNIRILNTEMDSFHWHYHQPPRNGIGDQWSDDWTSSDEHYAILGHRLMHRGTFPSAFRAGGTIEDDRCSHWLEDNIMIDYSNRINRESRFTNNIANFSWYGAPSHWGFYHPSCRSFLQMGDMRRYIVRSVDAMSRFHMLSQYDVDQAFACARATGQRVILSYFSHDHRDMRNETRMAAKQVRIASDRYKTPFVWSDAVAAVQGAAGLPPYQVKIIKKLHGNRVEISFSHPIYQKHPFLYTLDENGVITYRKLDKEEIIDHNTTREGVFIDRYPGLKKIAIACHSMSGDVSLEVFDPWTL